MYALASVTKMYSMQIRSIPPFLLVVLIPGQQYIVSRSSFPCPGANIFEKKTAALKHSAIIFAIGQSHVQS